MSSIQLWVLLCCQDFTHRIFQLHIFEGENLTACALGTGVETGKMGRKRKAGEKRTGPHGQEEVDQNVKTTYDIDEQFADSEDEFFAERDEILLEEAPASKRRRKSEDEGMLLQ